MKLNFIGRGSALSETDTNNSAYLIKDNMLLLIDCGETVLEKIKHSNLLNGIKEVNVLITHFHSDHIGSLSSFIFYCFYRKNIKPNIYFPQRDKIHELLNMTGAMENVVWEDLSRDYMDKKYGLLITALKVPHVPYFRSYAYWIVDTATKEKVLYSGDTNKPLTGIKFDKYDITVYHDCCPYNFEENPHTYLGDLCDKVPLELRKYYYLMHIEGDSFIYEAKEEGFKIVEVDNQFK